MPLDPTISLQVRGPDIEPYQNVLANKLKIQGMQSEQQMNRLRMDEYQRGIEQDRAYNMLYQNAVKPDGTIDRSALITGAARGGLGSKIPGLQKGFLETDEKAGKVDEQKFKLATQRYDYMRKTMGALAQEPTLNKQMVEQAGQALVQQGILPPEMYQQAIGNMPDDPVQLRAALQQGLKSQMSPEQIFTLFAPKAEKVDNGQQISYRDMNSLSPTYGQATGGAPVQKVATPESVLSSQTTMRGQNMTDARARDFNLVQQDANNVKREEKKSIADLTKNSQIASMDTMLGTLDRLSSHPGLSRSVGLMGALPTAPGSQSANFQAELNTFQSQAFIPMVAQLKGMGALSDAEGKKLTAAVGALDPKMGEEAFRASVARIINDMEAARERLAGSRRTTGAAPAGASVSGKVVDFGSLK